MSINLEESILRARAEMKNNNTNIHKSKEKYDPEYISVTNNQLKRIFTNLLQLRKESEGKDFSEFNEDAYKTFKKNFKNILDLYDNLKIEDLDSEASPENKEYQIKFFKTQLEIQSLINRLAHKINKYENKKLIEIYDEKERCLETKIEKMDSLLKEVIDFKNNKFPYLTERVLTITSLVFTAFSLIQINFLAFSGSVKYSINDRILLFCAINIFLLMGIYTIFSLIRCTLEKDKYSFKLKLRIFIPIIFLVFIGYQCVQSSQKKEVISFIINYK